MFDKCVLFNLPASKLMCAGCVSSLYYIIQNIFLCSIIQNLQIKYTYILYVVVCKARRLVNMPFNTPTDHDWSLARPSQASSI